MRLQRFDVRGFRSLVNVLGIPVSAPTILAGHNDGGKTAVIDALRYLTGTYKLVDEDRSYLRTGGVAGERHEITEVHGYFQLDTWEQATFNRPTSMEIRRRSPVDGVPALEALTDVHEDEELHDLSTMLVGTLRDLANKHGVPSAGLNKAELRLALQDFAVKHATSQKWLPVPRDLANRLPEVLAFGGAAETPDAAVKTALMSRFTEYVSDPGMQGRITELEREIQDKLRDDAVDLCRHIGERCSDLGQISVDPRVSLSQGFAEAPLRIERSTGQPVKLDRSGLGSRRRISLAVWEWTSRLLQESEDIDQVPLSGGVQSTAAGNGEPGVDEPPLKQTIVVYDEPDTHLDYRHQRKVMQIIREQSALTHVNVLVATHSMNLIDGVDIGDVINLKLKDDQTVVERLEEDAHKTIDLHLGRIAASLGLRNSVLLHERVFLAVEGPSEDQAFPLLFRLSEGLSLQSAGIALWACGGNDGALSLAKYLTEHDRHVVMAVDLDSQENNKKMFGDIAVRRTFGATWADHVYFVGEAEDRTELEAVFSDEAWARTANKLWPRQDGDKWEESHFEALRSEPKFSTSVDRLLFEHVENFERGKPSLMAELAGSLSDAADVPKSLVRLFKRLQEAAS